MQVLSLVVGGRFSREQQRTYLVDAGHKDSLAPGLSIPTVGRYQQTSRETTNTDTVMEKEDKVSQLDSLIGTRPT